MGSVEFSIENELKIKEITWSVQCVPQSYRAISSFKAKQKKKENF